MNFPFNLSDDKEFDCVGFGVNAVDHLIVVPHYPAFDTKTRLLEHMQSAGGQTSSAMVGLSRLGLNVAYAGRFGSDAEGQFGIESLKREGVDTTFTEVIPNTRTQVGYIIIDARSGERTVIWDRDDRLAFSPDDAPVEIASRGRVLHIDAHDPPACQRMAEAARLTGTIVSADIDNIYNGLPDLMPFIDLLISSKEFPKRLTGIDDERKALMEIKSRYGCRLVGMTLGMRGSLVYHEGNFIEVPAMPVPGGCRDTTGAGDAFHAGLLFGLLTGENISTSLKLGSATSSLKCRGLGARQALPRKKELLEFLKA
jgi:sulfofructose kinase